MNTAKLLRPALTSRCHTQAYTARCCETTAYGVDGFVALVTLRREHLLFAQSSTTWSCVHVVLVHFPGSTLPTPPCPVPMPTLFATPCRVVFAGPGNRRLLTKGASPSATKPRLIRHSRTCDIRCDHRSCPMSPPNLSIILCSYLDECPPCVCKTCSARVFPAVCTVHPTYRYTPFHFFWLLRW